MTQAMNEVQSEVGHLFSDIPGKTATILLIEDEEAIVDLVKSVLELEGYNVLVALDGEQALSLFAQHQDEIDLIVSDLDLPRMKGDEVYIEIRKKNPDIKILFASGYIDDYMRTYLQALGVKEFVDKPYHPFQILNCIKSMLGAN